jgi:RES domain-containing protein
MASTPDFSAWRIDNAKWGGLSVTGKSSAVSGGRWNSAGISAIYASEHLAMAAHEKFVHLPRPLPHGMRLVKFGIRFGSAALHRVDISQLPADWRREPVSPSTQALGDAWLRSKKTAILAVPSALIPDETNFLINPRHPDFAKIEFTPATPFEFEPRLVRHAGAGG